MTQRIADNAWDIQGRTVTLPATIRDSTVAASVFCCSAAAARTAVTDDRLQPLTVAGRGIAVLFFARYHDGDLGAYDEVGLMVAVRGPGRGVMGAYTIELPVTQTFTLEAGRTIWGLPKWLARSTMTSRRSRAEVHLYDNTELILTAAFDAGRLRVPVPVTAPAAFWAIRPEGPGTGELLHGTFRLRLSGLRVRTRGARLVLGEHRMARTARALGMSRRPLFTAVGRMAAELGPFTPFHG
ncbi:MAG: acetoacetate decarboxylase family protein [Actinomycetota bacterium]|nr:acetoacetate decarboxylase family protein [Actinomycetota bacterium]